VSFAVSLTRKGPDFALVSYLLLDRAVRWVDHVKFWSSFALQRRCSPYVVDREEPRASLFLVRCGANVLLECKACPTSLRLDLRFFLIMLNFGLQRRRSPYVVDREEPRASHFLERCGANILLECEACSTDLCLNFWVLWLDWTGWKLNLKPISLLMGSATIVSRCKKHAVIRLGVLLTLQPHELSSKRQ
jgi:hypothetical protein